MFQYLQNSLSQCDTQLVYIYCHIHICITLRGQIKGFCRAIYLILPCFEGNIRYIALEPGQYLDIAREGGFWPAFDQSIDLPFDLQGTVMKTSFLI